MRYIIIQVPLFTALMRNQLKNYVYDNRGKYFEDTESTLISFDLDDPPPTRYYLLKWNGDKPSSVPSQYRKDGNNPKANKIFTHSEILVYLSANVNIEIPAIP